MTKCIVCNKDITNKNEFWHHAKGLTDEYFCSRQCLLTLKCECCDKIWTMMELKTSGSVRNVTFTRWRSHNGKHRRIGKISRGIYKKSN